MNRLEHVLAHYERVAPQSLVCDGAQSALLEAWLCQAVCPLVDELARTEHFQRLATWPFDRLSAEADTAERNLLVKIDGGLVDVANELCRVIGESSIRQQLLAQAGSWRPLALKWPADASDEIPGSSAVEILARRPWVDLVAPEEFFFPCRQLYTSENEPWIEEFDPLRNPKLTALGDHVTRRTFVRIDYWQSHLQRLTGQCTVALSGTVDVDLLNDVVIKSGMLDASVRQLTELCLREPEFGLRESCITLTQVYNGFGPTPQLDWLELPVDIITANRDLVRLSVCRPTCDVVAIQQIVKALQGIECLYRGSGSGEFRLAEAISQKNLVLVESPRIAYWHGDRIDHNWERKAKLWELFWELAFSAKRTMPVDRERLSNRASERAIRDRRSDLGQLLPQSLNDLIVSAGRYTYRLNLPPDDIALFYREEEVELVEEFSPPPHRLPL